MKKSNKKFVFYIIISIAFFLILFLGDSIIHWTRFISIWIDQSSKIERIKVICVILLIIIIISFVWIRQYENKCGGKHETARVISKILILTMLGNLCMNILGGMATNELYTGVLSDNAAGGEGKNDDEDEKYVPINDDVELQDSSQLDYPSVDRFIVGWSDNSGLENGRPFYTIDEINNGALGNQIVFNSISDSGIGHEADFVGARENTGINVGTSNTWNANSIEVENGKTYLIRLYVHNNSPNGWNSAALDTRIRFEIGDTVFVTETENNEGNYQAAVYGYITSSNAKPSQYIDGVRFVSERSFHLVYIFGTALFENGAVGAGAGYRLNDEIVTNGVLIGYEELNGEIPGCYQYVSYTTIKVMPVFDD